MNVAALDGENSVPVEITELNERQIEVLIPTEPPGAGSRDVTRWRSEAGPMTNAVGTGRARRTGTGSRGGRRDTRAPGRDEPPAPEPVAEPEPAAPRPAAGAAGNVAGRVRQGARHLVRPAGARGPAANPHMMITGETGSGKTQATKAILADMRAVQRAVALHSRFQGRLLRAGVRRGRGIQRLRPERPAAALQPAGPELVDPRSGRVNPTHHLHQLTDIIKRIYRLGDQQAYRLREAMKTVYENAGVPTRAFVPEADQAYPAFEVVQHELAADKTTRRCSAGCRRSSTWSCSARARG